MTVESMSNMMNALVIIAIIGIGILIYIAHKVDMMEIKTRVLDKMNNEYERRYGGRNR